MTTCEATRRDVLGASAALFAWAFAPHVASAAGARDPRFLTIILRGGLDGLSAVPPIGDPDYTRLRGDLALAREPVLPLDATFALNPAMRNLARLYQKREATVVHAVATPYRERSHFDGQDILETGWARTGGRDGWLNRALLAMPRGERVRAPGGLALGATTPLVLQGRAEVTSWAPAIWPNATEETVRRLYGLYEARDTALADALRLAMETDGIASANGLGGLRRANGGPDVLFAQQATTAARFLRMPDGPRVAAMSFDGWDTHVDQGPRGGRLARLLAALDGAIGALESGLGEVWSQTVVAIVTEFGRTARANGSEGTDHGTATVAFLVGGAVSGGRVIANWPGLAAAKLHENRDLAPTLDLRRILAGVMREHVGLRAGEVAGSIFPGLDPGGVLRDLVRA
jgi:uncharacterized protein (DUF1501 family)